MLLGTPACLSTMWGGSCVRRDMTVRCSVGVFFAFENIILLALILCQLPFNSSHVKANHRTTDAKLPHRVIFTCLCPGPLQAALGIRRCCPVMGLWSSVVSFFSGCLRGRSMFLFLLGCNRSGGKRDSSAWRCSPPQPPVISSLPALQTADVRGATARLCKTCCRHEGHRSSTAPADDFCDL